MTILNLLERAGLLRHWKAELDADESIHRHIFMLPDVYKWIESRAARDLNAVDTRRFLKPFVSGGFFDDPEKLKNLDTDDHIGPDDGLYAFRIKRRPQTRIFGSFAAPNIFVATHYRRRKDIDWPTEKQRIKTIWKALIALDPSGSQAYNLPRETAKSRAQLTDNLSEFDD